MPYKFNPHTFNLDYYSSGSGGGGADTLLRGKRVRSIRYQVIASGTSGTLTPIANATFVVDSFGGGADAISAEITAGNLTQQSAKTSGGAVVAVNLNTSTGAWTLSGTPSVYPFAIVFEVYQDAEDYDSTSSDIVGVPVFIDKDGLANTSLNNLSNVSINSDLMPDSDQSRSMGDDLNRWNRIQAKRLDFESGFSYIDIKNEKIFDGNDHLSIDYYNRVLGDDDGVSSVAWNARTLLDLNGATSVDWSSRYLADDSENKVLDFLERRLFSTDGATPTFDWSPNDGPTTVTQSPNNNSQKVATTQYVDAQPKVIVNVFTSSGTWTKPAGAKLVKVYAVGGGGGGGSGRKGLAGTVRCGGGGGGPSLLVVGEFDPSLMASTVTVTIGAGGTGGAGQTTDSSNGVSGTAGGSTSFGPWLTAIGGNFGAGGTATNGTGGASRSSTPSPMNHTGLAGAAASTTGAAGVAPTVSTFPTPQGGASGAGITSANAVSNGAAGGAINTTFGTNFAATAGTSGGAAPGVGGNGSNSTYLFGVGHGSGGGSTGSSLTLSSGNGGNGGYGAGGGGTGAVVDANGNSGKGGDGGPGWLVAITYL